MTSKNYTRGDCIRLAARYDKWMLRRPRDTSPPRPPSPASSTAEESGAAGAARLPPTTPMPETSSLLEKFRALEKQVQNPPFIMPRDDLAERGFTTDKFIHGCDQAQKTLPEFHRALYLFIGSLYPLLLPTKPVAQKPREAREKPPEQLAEEKRLRSKSIDALNWGQRYTRLSESQFTTNFENLLRQWQRKLEILRAYPPSLTGNPTDDAKLLKRIRKIKAIERELQDLINKTYSTLATTVFRLLGEMLNPSSPLSVTTRVSAMASPGQLALPPASVPGAAAGAAGAGALAAPAAVTAGGARSAEHTA